MATGGRSWAWAMALAVAGPAAAQTAVLPPPATHNRWNVDGSGNQCVLARGAESPDGATFAIRTYPGSGQYSVTLIGQHWPNGLRKEGAELSFRFSAPDSIATRPASILRGGPGQTIGTDGLDAGFMNGMERAAKMDIAFRDATIATIALPNGEKAVHALQYCERAKLVEAGADDALLDPAARIPERIGNSGRWVDLSKFYSVQGMKNESARYFSVARLDIAADGKVERCATWESLGNGQMDTFVCEQLMAHASYAPARSKTRAAVRSVASYVYDLVIVSKVTATKF